MWTELRSTFNIAHTHVAVPTKLYYEFGAGDINRTTDWIEAVIKVADKVENGFVFQQVRGSRGVEYMRLSMNDFEPWPNTAGEKKFCFCEMHKNQKTAYIDSDWGARILTLGTRIPNAQFFEQTESGKYKRIMLVESDKREE